MSKTSSLPKETLLKLFIFPLMTYSLLFTPLLLILWESPQKQPSKSIKLSSFLILIWLVALILFELFAQIPENTWSALDALSFVYLILLIYFALLIWLIGKKNSSYWGRFCRWSCFLFALYTISFLFIPWLRMPYLHPPAVVLGIHLIPLIGFVLGCLEIIPVWQGTRAPTNLLGFFLNLEQFLHFWLDLEQSLRYY